MAAMVHILLQASRCFRLVAVDITVVYSRFYSILLCSIKLYYILLYAFHVIVDSATAWTRWTTSTVSCWINSLTLIQCIEYAIVVESEGFEMSTCFESQGGHNGHHVSSQI